MKAGISILVALALFVSGCMVGESRINQERETAAETESEAAITNEGDSGETMAAHEYENNIRVITMEEVRQFASSEDKLALTDFQEFQSEESDFPTLRQYRFFYQGEEYSLDINFNKETEELENIRLVRVADNLSIDIRSGIIDHLIEGTVSMSDYLEYDLPDDLMNGLYNIYIYIYG